MEDIKNIVKSVVNAAAQITVAAVGITVTSVEKVIEIAKEIKHNTELELFVAKEGYNRFVINKTKNTKYSIYQVFNSQEKIEYLIDGRLTPKNCAVNFVVGDQVVADVYEIRSKRRKGLIHDSVSYEFCLEVNDEHYGIISVGFDEGKLHFELDTNKWRAYSRVNDRKVEIYDEYEQVIASIDMKPGVRDMITVDVKENHNQLLALMYGFVVIAINKYARK
ncbi:MAG TPA: hypothetical protein PLI19_02620 [Erysipelotrichaceae bacterium]|nr:hypothetical protein [Erysipelotrichaceae bacterium]HQB32204.1 hypothetical protein [Erysipelotrichaceae bacterium]